MNTATPNLILEPEDHIARIGFILAADQRMETVAIIDLDRREGALDDSIIHIFRDGEQSRLILGFPVFHDRVVQLDHITVIVTLRTGTGQVVVVILPGGSAVVGGEIIGDVCGAGNVYIHPEGTLRLGADAKQNASRIA